MTINHLFFATAGLMVTLFGMAAAFRTRDEAVASAGDVLDEIGLTAGVQFETQVAYVSLDSIRKRIAVSGPASRWIKRTSYPGVRLGKARACVQGDRHPSLTKTDNVRQPIGIHIH